MARIKKELTELIGGTPLLELSRLSKKHDAKAQIIAKLEYFNPGGSVKDRIALAMIEDAEAKGILKPGAVIIEPTSGNTGVGLAWVASVKGYKAILTMPETMPLASNAGHNTDPFSSMPCVDACSRNNKCLHFISVIFQVK